MVEGMNRDCVPMCQQPTLTATMTARIRDTELLPATAHIVSCNGLFLGNAVTIALTFRCH